MNRWKIANVMSDRTMFNVSYDIQNIPHYLYGTVVSYDIGARTGQDRTGQDRTGQDIVTLCTLHCSVQNEAKPTTVHYIQSDCALDHQVCNVLYCTVLDAHL